MAAPEKKKDPALGGLFGAASALGSGVTTPP